MLFVPNRRAVKLYGAGRCIQHLTDKKREKETENIVNEGGKMDEHKIDNIVDSKPNMDKIINKLNNMKSLKRRKIVFDG